MPLKAAIIASILYFLMLLQSSFLPHFSFFGYFPNIIFILIIFSIFLSSPLAIVSAFAGGIFLDIISNHFLGFYVLMLLGIVSFLKLVLKRYVQISFG